MDSKENVDGKKDEKKDGKKDEKKDDAGFLWGGYPYLFSPWSFYGVDPFLLNMYGGLGMFGGLGWNGGLGTLGA